MIELPPHTEPAKTPVNILSMDKALLEELNKLLDEYSYLSLIHI